MTFNCDCCDNLCIAGLDLLHLLTNSNSYQLRIDLEDWDENTVYALYRYVIPNYPSVYKSEPIFKERSLPPEHI